MSLEAGMPTDIVIWSITVDGKDFVGVTLQDSC